MWFQGDIIEQIHKDGGDVVGSRIEVLTDRLNGHYWKVKCIEPSTQQNIWFTYSTSMHYYRLVGNTNGDTYYVAQRIEDGHYWKNNQYFADIKEAHVFRSRPKVSIGNQAVKFDYDPRRFGITIPGVVISNKTNNTKSGMELIVIIPNFSYAETKPKKPEELEKIIKHAIASDRYSLSQHELTDTKTVTTLSFEVGDDKIGAIKFIRAYMFSRIGLAEAKVFFEETYKQGIRKYTVRAE